MQQLPFPEGANLLGIRTDGIVVYDQHQTGGWIGGAKAELVTQGTMTREARFTDPGWRGKKTATVAREIYIVVEGVGYAFTTSVPRMLEAQARLVVAQLNATAKLCPPPSGEPYLLEKHKTGRLSHEWVKQGLIGSIEAPRMPPPGVPGARPSGPSIPDPKSTFAPRKRNSSNMLAVGLIVVGVFAALVVMGALSGDKQTPDSTGPTTASWRRPKGQCRAAVTRADIFVRTTPGSDLARKLPGGTPVCWVEGQPTDEWIGIWYSLEHKQFENDYCNSPGQGFFDEQYCVGGWVRRSEIFSSTYDDTDAQP